MSISKKQSALASSLMTAGALSGLLLLGGSGARADDCYDQTQAFQSCQDVWNYAASADCGCGTGGNVSNYTCSGPHSYSFTCAS